MLRFIPGTVAVGVLASAVQVSAQTLNAPITGVTALSAAQFADMRGEYLMDDGSRLIIDGVRLRPVVLRDQRAPMPLLALGPNRLITADGKVLLEFRSHVDGMETVTLTMQVAAR